MVIAQDFAYVKAATIDDAVAALADAGPDAAVLAGGTDLVAWMRDGLSAPEVVIDIKGVSGLGEITATERVLRFGARVTVGDVITSPDVRATAPILIEMAHVFASNGIRHRATLAGNLCSAVPSCDAGPIFLVYDTVIHVVGPEGRRDIAIGDWFLGPRHTALEPGEVVVEITMGIPEAAHAGAFLKLARYEGEDLAQASVAILALGGNRRRLAFGAVAPTPFRARQIEALLEGSDLEDDLIDEAKALVAATVSPITDMRATKEYREHMCRVMLERGLRAATARLNGSGAPYPSRFV